MSKLPLEFDDSQLSDIIDGKDSNEVQYGPEDVLLVDNLDYNPDTQVPSSSHITKIKSPMGTTAGQILYNTLPTSMKHSQYTIPTFLGIFVLFIFFPIKLYAFIILVGLIVGYSLGVESETRFDDYFSIFSTRISLNKSNYDGEHRTGSIRGEHLAHVDGSSQTDESPFYPEFLRLIEDISRDLVDPWFNNISKEGGRDAFRGSFYMCMHGALAKILAMLRNRSKDALTLLIYGISNSLKMHISEFRKWEETSSGNKSDQSIERFLKTNSKRRVEVACDLERELSFLRETAAQLIERLMPKKELESELVRSFLTEVIGANALFALAEKITDPDWINQQIITKLQRPEEIYPSVSPGWNLMMLRMVRIRFTPLPTSAISQNLDPIKSRGLHLILNIAGRRVNTHRIIQEADISMEQYRFKLSDRVVGRVDMPFRVGVHLVMHTCDPEDSESCDIMRRRLHNTTSVVQYRSGRCAIVGSVKISPTFTTAYPQTNHSWIKFTPKTNVPTDELFDGRGLPEIMLEITVMSGSPSENIVSKEVVENIDTNAALDFVSQSNLPDVLPLLGKNSSVDSGQSAVENLKTLLFSLISNHEHYMELLEYTKSVNAPPYLQFLMNLDALHQFTSISAVKSPSNELINGELTSSDNYHQVSSPINLKTALTNEQIIRLKVIKRDSLDIFNTHLTPGGRYYIPVKLVLDEFSSYDDSPSNLDHQDLIDSIEADIKRSDSINSEGAYDGGPIGADIFKNLCDIVSTLFSREFMPGFMKSDSYVRIKVNAKTSTSSIIRIEEEDFKESTLSESPIKSSIDLGSGSVSESPKKTLFDDGDQRRLYPQIVANKNDAGVTRIAEQITICKHSLAIMQDRGEPQHHLIKKQQEIESLIRLLRQRESEMGRRMFDIIQGESDGALVDENLDRSNEQNGVFDEVNQEDWEGLDELLDLEGLSVSVSLVNIKSTNQKDSGSGGILSTVLNKAAAPISTIAGALSNSADSALYIVTLEKADDVEFGHVIRRVRRRYKDFARLHRHLSRNFTKVSKIPLPPIGSVASALESYLGVLVGDELVRQSLELRRFVSFVDDIVPDDEDSNYQGATDPVTGENKNFLYGINTSSSDFKYSAKNTLSNGETYSKKRWAVMGSRSTIASIGRKFRGAINTGISVIGGVSSSPNLNLIGEDYGSDRSRSETSIHELTLPLRDEIESKSDSRFIEHLDISKPKKEVSNAIDKNSIKKIDSLDSDVILEQISFTEEEAEMLVEIFFSLITETFDLQQPNQWLRLRLLAIFKQILKQAYGDALAKALSDQINSTLTPPSIRSYPVKIREFVYPLVPPNALRKSTGVSEDKSFINEEELTMTDEAKLKKSVSKGDRMFIIQHQKEFPLPMRSDDERYATMLAARAVLLRYISQASMTTSLERLVGHYSMVSGVTRIFAALQHRKLNKVLFYSLLDCIVKLLLTDIE